MKTKPMRSAEGGVRKGKPRGSRLGRLAICIVFGLILPVAHGQGRLLPPQSIPSAALGTNRTIRIYLPPSYDRETNRHYPVLYLHDGQNVFSSAGTNCCFGWGNWELDKTVDALCRDHKMREIIMVGVDCTAHRVEEYSGRSTHATFGTNSLFDQYTTFLLQELKPKMDRDYRTLKDPANTGVMGSSMGGICSAALVIQHPQIFRLAASLSGAYQVDQTNFLKHVLGRETPGSFYTRASYCCEVYEDNVEILDRIERINRGDVPANIYKFRIYVDSGVVDYTGGDDNRTLSAQVADELRRIAGTNAVEYYLDAAPMTEAQLEKAGLRRDKWREAQTSQHNEFYWRQRAWRPLTFLFPSE